MIWQSLAEEFRYFPSFDEIALETIQTCFTGQKSLIKVTRRSDSPEIIEEGFSGDFTAKSSRESFFYYCQRLLWFRAQEAIQQKTGGIHSPGGFRDSPDVPNAFDVEGFLAALCNDGP